MNLRLYNADFFVVAAYGKILPKLIFDFPQYKTLNVHPSLLPLFRGPSPIQSALLHGEKKTGITIILLDEKMDHGPMLVRESLLVGKDDTNQSLTVKRGRL
jgi:methionyl-tRNA formyltransferase